MITPVAEIIDFHEIVRARTRRRSRALTVCCLDIMEACLANQDWKQLAETAHSLRGASASVGFPRVAALCKDMELGSRKLTNVNLNITDIANASQAQAAFDEIFELIQHYYREADRALAVWLSEDSTLSKK